MSNRQYPSTPWWSKGDRPEGVVHSASHGRTVFNRPSWFEDNKVKPCRDDCGIASTEKSAHYHPAETR